MQSTVTEAVVLFHFLETKDFFTHVYFTCLLVFGVCGGGGGGVIIGRESSLCLATLTGKLHKCAKDSSRSLHRENVHVLCLQYRPCSPSSVGVGSYILLSNLCGDTSATGIAIAFVVTGTSGWRWTV